MKRIFVFLATLLFANNSFSQKIEIVFPMEYDSIRLLTTSVLKLYKNGENSFLDMQSGIQLKNFDDGEFLGFSNGLGIVKKREKYFYVDSTGKRTSKKYDVLSWMNSEGIGYAKKGKKEYLLGKKDEILFQTKNGEIISYNENFVVVAQDGKKLVLDFEGEKIIPFDITHLIKIDDGNYWVFNTEKKRWE